MWYASHFVLAFREAGQIKYLDASLQYADSAYVASNKFTIIKHPGPYDDSVMAIHGVGNPTSEPNRNSKYTWLVLDYPADNIEDIRMGSFSHYDIPCEYRDKVKSMGITLSNVAENFINKICSRP